MLETYLKKIGSFLWPITNIFLFFSFSSFLFIIYFLFLFDWFIHYYSKDENIHCCCCYRPIVVVVVVVVVVIVAVRGVLIITSTPTVTVIPCFIYYKFLSFLSFSHLETGWIHFVIWIGLKKGGRRTFMW